jgi:hypothetical protein
MISFLYSSTVLSIFINASSLLLMAAALMSSALPSRVMVILFPSTL